MPASILLDNINIGGPDDHQWHSLPSPRDPGGAHLQFGLVIRGSGVTKDKVREAIDAMGATHKVARYNVMGGVGLPLWVTIVVGDVDTASMCGKNFDANPAAQAVVNPIIEQLKARLND